MDESGLLMAPLVRRSWSPAGHTPVLRQQMRTHLKVSAIAALVWDIHRRHVSLYFKLFPGISIKTQEAMVFSRYLFRYLKGRPVLWIWDRLPVHRSKKLNGVLQSRENITAMLLPPYAPELNPVEYVWSHLKYNLLANLAPETLDELTDTSRHHGRRIQRKQELLQSLLFHSPLFSLD
ncbi:transposase [Gemmatimonadota bacterium]